jgi:hypothetical protein
LADSNTWELADTIQSAQLYLYPGDHHLFSDSSLSDYDQTAVELASHRITAFLDPPPKPPTARRRLRLVFYETQPACSQES